MKRTEYEYSHNEIAEFLGVSVSCVKQIEREALKKINIILEEKEIL